VTDFSSEKEFRLRRGSHILGYIRQFSATEKVIFGILVIAMLISALAMAARSADGFMTEVPAHGGTLREGIVGLPRTVNPVLAVTDADKDLSALVYAGLMRSEGGSIIPDIAESYVVSDDGLNYTFNLRQGVRFHDGRELTAADVAFTIQKIQDPALKSPRRADWVNVAVSEISPTEIQFSLKQPYTPFITNTTVGILPKHIWGEVSDEQFIFSQYNIEPIGAGPYKISSISRDAGGIPTKYDLSVWRRYHGQEPHISTIVFNFFADEEKALAALHAGHVDSIGTISPVPAARLAAATAARYTVISTPLPRIFGVFFNQNQSTVLSDKIVRQALDLAVDRDSMVKTILSGYGDPIRGPLPPGTAGTSTPVDGSANIADAQELLEKNGWKINSSGIYEKKVGTSVRLLSFSLYTADVADLKQAADMVKASWTALGAKVELKVFEPSDLYQNIIRTRKYDALLFGEQIGKDRDLYAFWHSSQRNAPGLNVAMYTNSSADKLLEEIRSSKDDAVRAEKYRRFEQVVRTDIPAIFLYAPRFIYAVPKTLNLGRLDGMTVPSDRWNSIASWYVTTEKVWRIFAGDEAQVGI